MRRAGDHDPAPDRPRVPGGARGATATDPEGFDDRCGRGRGLRRGHVPRLCGQCTAGPSRAALRCEAGFPGMTQIYVELRQPSERPHGVSFTR